MKDRLVEFMRLEGLTSVKFAEIMGVQPSSISHILAGRNNPSFDFISKILSLFPALNPDWIINGAGGIYRSENKDKQGEKPEITNVNKAAFTDVTQNNDINLGAIPPIPSIEVTESINLNKEDTGSATIVTNKDKLHVNNDEKRDSMLSAPLQKPVLAPTSNTQKQPLDQETSNSTDIVDIVSSVSNNRKQIVKIVMFYSDNSFEVFSNN